MNSRELAGLIWFAVLVAVALSKRENRPIFGHVMRCFLDRRILLVTGGYAVYLILVALFARFIGLWERFLLPETVLWFFLAGFPILFTVMNAKDIGFFGKTLRSELGLSIVFVFFVNLSTFGLVWELLLQPIFFAIAGISIIILRMISVGSSGPRCPARWWN